MLFRLSQALDSRYPAPLRHVWSDGGTAAMRGMGVRMNWTDLLPSWVDVSWTVAIVTALGMFFRERIAKAIDARVQHHYNAELEKLKDELSRSSKEIDTLRACLATQVLGSGVLRWGDLSYT